MDKEGFWMLMILLVGLGALGQSFTNLKVAEQYYEKSLLKYNQSCERYQMYVPFNATPDKAPLGIYFHKKYYTTWLEGRDIKSIASNDNHEVCHHLVANKTEHFCGWYINQSHI